MTIDGGAKKSGLSVPIYIVFGSIVLRSMNGKIRVVVVFHVFLVP